MIARFKIPELGEGIDSGDVTQIPVAVGDCIDKDRTLMEVEAGKANLEIPSPVAGIIKAICVAVGDTVHAGQLAVEIESDDQNSQDGDQTSEPAVPESELEPEAEQKLETPPAQSSKLPGAASVSAAPNVRKLARELGIDIHRVPPCGPPGHISANDVKEFARQALQAGSSGVVLPQRGVRAEKMSSARKATLKHMAHCWATIPHVTHHDTADITRLEELRKRYAPRVEAADAKLTMTAVLIKVIASALKVHPKFNCSIDPDKAEIFYKDFYNIGIAMDTPKGLLVPVIRDGDRKNIVELALELRALIDRAGQGKLTAAELTGGTFTFTNVGIVGGSFFTPIVNSPEVAILGSGRAHWVPGVEDGQMYFRLPLSLSYDHRIIDGADAARFLKWIIDAMEEPMLLSLEG